MSRQIYNKSDSAHDDMGFKGGKMKSTRGFIYILITILSFLGACTKVGPATPEMTPLPATNTPIIPTVTSSPTMVIPTLTPTPALISIEIPECIPDGSGGELDFSETLIGTSARMLEWESYRFSTLYEFFLDGNYSPEDLSVQIQGEYSGLLEEPTEYLLNSPLSSQRYEDSRVIYNDLRARQQSETIITPAGFWHRPPGETNWIAFEGATGADIFQFGEMLSPESVVYLLNNINFQPGVQASQTAFEKPETIDGKAVIHRCWVIPSYDEGPDAYLIHGNYIYTLLKKAEVHLWTADNDTELIRLVLTGSHTGEYYHEQGLDLHDTPSQFILWLDVDKIDQPITIDQPPEDAIVATLPDSVIEQNEISDYPFNDFPLPKDALADSTGASQTVPLEFLVDDYYLKSELPSQFLGPLWYQTTSDRWPQYITQASLPELSSFYLAEMSLRGWTLAEKFLEAGFQRLFLFFQREQITLLIVLTPLSDGSLHIQALLPPSDEVLEVIQNNWVFFDETDDPMLSEDINAIAFDSQGQAWIGTKSGVVKYNGTTWTDITAEEIGLERSDITAIAVDQTDNVWVGNFSGIARYDGAAWTTFTADSLGNPIGWVKTIAITPSGDVMVGLTEGKVGVYDGIRWKIYSRGDGGPETAHDIEAIAFDPSGKVWIGTQGGGIFVRENNEWRTVVKDLSVPNDITYMILGMAFDQRGWLWVAKSHSLQVFDGMVWYDYNEQSKDLPFSSIDRVVLDQYNRVWVATYHNGLAMQEADGRWTIYSPLHPSEEIFSTNAMAFDTSGRIWIGTNSGISVFTTPLTDSIIERSPLPTPNPSPTPEPLPEPQGDWTSYALEGTPFGSWINSIAVDQQNHIWIGGWGGTVVKEGGEWTQYTLANTPDSGLLSDSVNDIAVDELGRVWMATDNGLSILDESSGWSNYIPETSDMPFRNVEDVEIDSEGGVWVWTEDNSGNNTLSMIIPGSPWITYTSDTLTNPDDRPLSFFVTAIETDHQGGMWIAYYDGLAVLSKAGHLESITNNELGLSEDWNAKVTSLFVDDQNRVWIGTSEDGVIVLFNDGTTVHYSLFAMGLYGGEISTIIIDDIGRVWVGSNVGLSVLNDDGSWTTYNPDNSALPSAEITSLAIDKLGRMWVGTGAGLAVYVWPAP